MGRDDTGRFDTLAAQLAADIADIAATDPDRLGETDGIRTFAERTARYREPAPDGLHRHRYMAGRAWTDLHLVALLAAGAVAVVTTPECPWRRRAARRAVRQLLVDGVRLPDRLEQIAAAEIGRIVGAEGPLTKHHPVRQMLRSEATLQRIVTFATAVTNPDGRN